MSGNSWLLIIQDGGLQLGGQSPVACQSLQLPWYCVMNKKKKYYQTLSCWSALAVPSLFLTIIIGQEFPVFFSYSILLMDLKLLLSIQDFSLLMVQWNLWTKTPSKEHWPSSYVCLPKTFHYLTVIYMSQHLSSKTTCWVHQRWSLFASFTVSTQCQIFGG